MSRPRLSWLRALTGLGALLLVAGAALAAQAAEEERVQQVEDEQEAWRGLLERDARVSFTARTEHDARVALSQPDLAPADRDAAVMALGCARPEALRELSTLESLATSAPTIGLRETATLALGEFGINVEATLLRLLEDREDRVRGCAMLALLRTDRASSRARVVAVAEGEGPDSALARELLVATLDPQSSRPNWVGALLLDLRWRAARRFGLVDGMSWKLRQLQDLLARGAFLDGVILRASAGQLEEGVNDHLLSMLIADQSAATLRAATRAMPDELATLIAKRGLILPGAGAWRLILEEIDESGLEGESLGLLELALDEPEVAVRSITLLARAGLEDVLFGIEGEWGSLSPLDRLSLLDAWAGTGDPIYLTKLARITDGGNARVRAALGVTRAELGDSAARGELLEVLADPDHPQFSATYQALLRGVRRPFARELVVALLPSLQGLERIAGTTELALLGDLESTGQLAELLSDELPRGRAGARAIRALRGPSAGLHTELFVHHFPVEGDLDLNVELALALLDARSPRALFFLRPALWDDPFDRSVLAGLLVTKLAGLHSLRDELNRPPVEANSRDLRRLGFALGEWGGIEEVESLRRGYGLLPGDAVLQGAILGALARRTH
jgi:hypothetical protein